MSVLVFAGLFLSIIALIMIVVGVFVVKKRSHKVILAAGLLVLVVAGGMAVFAFKNFSEVAEKEKAAQEERIKAQAEKEERELALKRAAAEQKKKKEAEEARKAEMARKAELEKKAALESKTKKKPADKQAAGEKSVKPQEKTEGTEPSPQKIKEWNRLGKALAEVEADLYNQTIEIDKQVRQIGEDYSQGKLNSYEELRQRATLGLKKQELIIAAQDKKKALLDAAVLITDEEKSNDMALLQRRKSQALTEKARFTEMLKQVEDNKKQYRSM